MEKIDLEKKTSHLDKNKMILPKTIFNSFFTINEIENGWRITKCAKAGPHQSIPFTGLQSGVHYLSLAPKKITHTQTYLSSFAVSVMPTAETNPWPQFLATNPFLHNFPGSASNGPVQNVAAKAQFLNPAVLPDKKVNMLTDSDAPRPEFLSGAGGSGHFSYCPATSFMLIGLDRPYDVDHFKILFWDGDSRIYTYTMEVSPDGTASWITVVNSQPGKGWTTIPYSGKVTHIKIQGTTNSTAYLHIVRFQVWAHTKGLSHPTDLLVHCRSCGFLNNTQYYSGSTFPTFDGFDLDQETLLQRKIGLLVDFPRDLVRLYLVNLENQIIATHTLLTGISGLTIIPIISLEHSGDIIESLLEDIPTAKAPEEVKSSSAGRREK